MSYKFNIQYLFSYLGLFPFIVIIINKYFLFQIKEETSDNFIIYYTIIILVFVGSTNWNLSSKIKNHIVLYGFLPSLFALIIIVLNLLNYNTFLLFVFLISFLIFQLTFDYILIYSKQINKNPFYFLRFPLTVFIIIFLVIIKF